MSRFFSRRIGIPGFTPSRGVLNQLMLRLSRANEECGGHAFATDAEEEATDGLSRFETLKISIAKKINAVREELQNVDLCKNPDSRIRKKQDIRKMLAFVKRDYENLEKIKVRKGKRWAFLFRRSEEELDQEREEQQERERDMGIIRQHISEVERLYMRPYMRQRGTTSNSGGNSDIIGRVHIEEEEEGAALGVGGTGRRARRRKQEQRSVFGSDSEDSENDDDARDALFDDLDIDGGGGGGHSNYGAIVVEDDPGGGFGGGSMIPNSRRYGIPQSALPDDPTETTLPEIDISRAMLKVQRNKKQLNEGIQKFGSLVDQLKVAAIEVGDTLGEGEMLLDENKEKIEDRTEEVKKLNTMAVKAKDSVAGSTRLCCVTCALICCVVLVVIVYAILMGTGVLGPSGS